METLIKYPSMTLTEWVAKHGLRVYLSEEIKQDSVFLHAVRTSPRSKKPSLQEVKDWQKCLQEFEQLDFEEAKQRLGVTLIRDSEESPYRDYDGYPDLDPLKEYGMNY